MNDADASVRLSSLISLKSIFQKWGIEEPLLLFHQRFVNRILEMSQDVDSSVVSASVDLVTQLMKYDYPFCHIFEQFFLRFPELEFDEEKLDQIPRMLWDASSSVRKAVAYHIYETAFSHDGEEKNGIFLHCIDIAQIPR